MSAWLCVVAVAYTLNPVLPPDAGATVQATPSAADQSDQPATDTTSAAQGDQNDLLAGPKVAESETKPTIVHRNFDGTLQEIDPEPDITAINILQLSESQRAQFTQILKQRYTAFDDIVRRNYGLIQELASLQGKSNTEDALATLERTRAVFDSYIKRGSFLDEMRVHLDAKQIEQVNAILNEYRQARMAELKRALGEDAPLRQIASRARLEAFGQMIRQSIERQIGLAREIFERLADELNLTEDQKRRIETILQPLAVKQFQRIETLADRSEAFRKIRELLNPEQRRAFLEYLLKQWMSSETESAAPVDAAAPTAAPQIMQE